MSTNPEPTRSFRPDKEAGKIWDDPTFKQFQGFKTKLLSWFIKQIHPIILRDKGKFFTALHDGKLTIEVNYEE